MALDYFSTSRPTQLTAAMTNVDTAVLVADGVTYPDPAINGRQYTVIIGYGSDREEICTVIAKPNPTTLTVVRAQDGTAATTKNIGDTVVHGVSARDFKRIDTNESDIDAVETAVAALQSTDTALQAGKYDKTGGPVTGPVTLPGDGTNPLHAATVQQVNTKAPLASPALTGDPTAPTPATTDNDTSIATTAYVAARVAQDAPTKIGGGASGNWPIGITGNAATATNAMAVNGIEFHFTDPGAVQPYLWTGNPADATHSKLMQTGHLAPANHGYHPRTTATTVFTSDGNGQAYIGIGFGDFNTIVQCNGDFISHNRAVSLRGDYGNGFGLTNMNANQATRCNWIAT